jgi:DNA-binding beta-propeller fold protein YncE
MTFQESDSTAAPCIRTNRSNARRLSLGFKWRICLLLTLTLQLCAAAQDRQPLKLIATTPMPGLSGDFDHFAVDLKGKRLFVAAEEGKSVEVFNLDGKPIHSIKGFGQPHAVVYLPDSDNLIVTDGDHFGMVELVSGKTYQIVDRIKLPPGVDVALYNSVNKYYYVESGNEQPGATNHVLSVIDAKLFKLVGSITLPGTHSQAMVVDREGKKLYVNLTGTDEVGVVDLASGTLSARWHVPDAEIGNSMALDEANHRLFIATRKPAKFFVFDTDTGKVITVLPCTSMNDDMWFHAALKRIYVTGTETTSVFEQSDADHYAKLADVQTGYRAKTSLLVPELNRLYVAVSGKLKPGANLALKVYEVEQAGQSTADRTP